MNWTAVVIVAMWVSASIGSISTRDWLPFLAALLGTAMVGYGYLVGGK